MLSDVSIIPVPAAAPVAAAPPPPAQITTTTAPLIKGRIRIQTALQSKHIGYISLQEQNQLRITPAARDALIVRLGTSGNARTLESVSGTSQPRFLIILLISLGWCIQPLCRRSLGGYERLGLGT